MQTLSLWSKQWSWQMGHHSESWNEDWTTGGNTGTALFSSIHSLRTPSQPMHWDADINQGQQRMRVKKWPGRRGAAAINQELIQSCEMPRLINLCQHFLRCRARSLVSPLPSLSPLSLAQRMAPLLHGDKKKEVEPQSEFCQAGC